MADFSTVFASSIGSTVTLSDPAGRSLVTGTLQQIVVGPPRKIIIRVNKSGTGFTSTNDHEFTETKIDTIERGADVTALSSPRLEPQGGNLTVFCDYTGVIKSGELPITVQMKRWKGITDVSSSTTWSVSNNNATATISAGGLVTITAISASGYVTVSSDRDSVKRDAVITITTVLDPPPPAPPPPSQTITMTTTSTFTLISATAAPGTVICQNLIVTAPATPKYFSLTAPLTYYIHSDSTNKDGDSVLSGKWQYRNLDTAGAWTDVHATVAGSATYKDYFFENKAGSITLNATLNLNGQFQGNRLEFRIVMWQSSTNTLVSSSSQNPPFYIKSGSATVVWAG